jgi:colanic acid biosynthesis glycosyl transferase WcaI
VPSARQGASDDRRPGVKVLITSAYYWPEAAGNAPYVTGLAEYLASRGHHVVVATGFPHYPQWRSSSHGRFATKELRGGVEIRRRWHYVPKVQSARTRGIYEVSLCAFGLTALPSGKPDVVLGVLPTLSAAVLARTAARLYRRPYALVFQDLLGLGASQSGIHGGTRIAALVERIEMSLARDADAIVVIAEGFRRYFEARGVPAGRIHRVRNWAQSAVSADSVEETRSRLGWEPGVFVCLHAGNIGHKQGLENVLNAARLLDSSNIRIVLAGDGNERARLEAEATQQRLANLCFLPLQPPGQYEAMLRAADVLIVNQRASVGEMSLASKLTSYFLAGRPVIGAVAESSETADELRSSGAGILVSPGDPDALTQAILWMRNNPELALEQAENGRRYAQKHLAASSILWSYEALLISIMADGASGKSRL